MFLNVLNGGCAACANEHLSMLPLAANTGFLNVCFCAYAACISRRQPMISLADNAHQRSQ